MDRAQLPEVLWVEDLVVVLGITPQAVRQQIRRGWIPARKWGQGRSSRYYVLKTALFQALAAGR